MSKGTMTEYRATPKFIPYKSFLYVIIILYHFIYFNNCIILSHKKLIITFFNENIRRKRIMWDIVLEIQKT